MLKIIEYLKNILNLINEYGLSFIVGILLLIMAFLLIVIGFKTNWKNVEPKLGKGSFSFAVALIELPWLYKILSSLFFIIGISVLLVTIKSPKQADNLNSINIDTIPKRFIEESQPIKLSVTPKKSTKKIIKTKNDTIVVKNYNELKAILGSNKIIKLKADTLYGMLELNGLKNITIIGAGNSDYTWFLENAMNPVLRLKRCHNVKIIGIGAVHERYNSDGCYGDCIYLWGCRNTVIKNCHLDGTGAYGVKGDGCFNTKVIDTKITNCSCGALYFSKCVQGVTVSNNEIIESRGSIYFLECDSVIFSGNHIENTDLTRRGLCKTPYLDEHIEQYIFYVTSDFTQIESNYWTANESQKGFYISTKEGGFWKNNPIQFNRFTGLDNSKDTIEIDFIKPFMIK